ATLQKAMVIQRAALAPAEPSAQDYKVAQAAMQMMTQARIEISQKNQQEQYEAADENKNNLVVTGQTQGIDSKELNQAITTKGSDNELDLLAQTRQQFNLRLQLSRTDAVYS
ncbi:MAG: hypothetical protein R3254_09115, partial [Thiomicrorhabdus sp.]|nr:hypothetical protein [Thiomicrorhabdus sp.]